MLKFGLWLRILLFVTVSVVYVLSLGESTGVAHAPMVTREAALVDLTPIIEEFKTSLIVISEYAEILNVASIEFSPYIITEAEIYARNPFWGFGGKLRKELLGLSKGIRSLLTIIGPGSGMLISCRLSTSLRVMKFCEPNPVFNVSLHPQRVVIVKGSEVGCSEFTWSNHYTTGRGFLRTFLREVVPVVYIITYEFPSMKEERERKDLRPFFKEVCIICLFCEDYNRKLPRGQGIQEPTLEYTTYAYDGKVRGRLEALLDEEARFGMKTYWIHREWTTPENVQLLSLAEERGWKEKRLGVSLLKIIFPLSKNTSTRVGLRTYIPEQYEMPGFEIFNEYYIEGDSDSELVFITSEMIEMNDMAAEVYFKNFDKATWALLSLSILLSSIVLSMLIVFSEDGISWRSRRIFHQFINNSVLLICGLLDQFPRQIAVRQTSERKLMKTGLQLLLIMWMLGTFVLNYGYKGVMKSNFSFLFPYKLSLHNWRDFENFSIYGFLSDERPRVRNPTVRHLGPWNSTTSPKFLHWELQDRLGQDPVPGLHTPVYSAEFFDYLTERNSKYRNHDPVLSWFERRIEEFSDCSKDNTSWRIVEQCRNDLRIVKTMQDRLDFIRPEDFHEYVGVAYKNTVSEARNRGLTMWSKWRIGLDGLRIGTYDRLEKLFAGNEWMEMYWMTRKPKAAFVTTRRDFPWFWNLFKKVMHADRSIKFSHTGDPALNGLTKVESVKSQASFRLTGPTFSYLPQANPILKRLRSLTSSGLVGFFEKWNKIMRPPRKESLHEEIKESVTGARSLSLKDGALVAVFDLLMTGLGMSYVVMLSEIFSSTYHRNKGT